MGEGAPETTDAATIAGALVWAALGAAFLAHNVWAAKARRLMSAHRCVRCGNAIPPETSEDSGSRKTCPRCRAKAQRGYRAGSAFFYGIAVLFAVVGCFIVVADVQHGGWSGGWPGAALLIGMIVIPAGAGWAIRHFGARER
jgi:predicted nucleic acid-binding Zn ribbon protein